MWLELGESFVVLRDEHMLLPALVPTWCLLMDEGLVPLVLVYAHT